ncbi:UvrD-helicase domain-containing protein [Clostridium fessum]|uniref:UvrD-helicase domain-containing protein n=1 Tax=Clostridium fessum TaxID=2126740 RepID=UPI0022E1BB8C|nr:UvrD-helicase domain-containing protein [Clostridium fessum]
MKKEIPLEKSYGDDHVDDHVDKEIEDCFSTKNPKCFFVFAGAGSGKTRSLINTLNFLDREQGENLLMNGKQVAVITYTNAACDEISRRLQYKTIFSVSTIHSFLWDLIKYYQADIKSWLVESVQKEIEELQRKKTKKTGSKAGEKREEKIKKKMDRLAKIRTVQKFSYNPNGDNVGYDSLSHSEVIKMSTEFIATEPTMQDILTSKYPILLIDESQDTKKELIDALLIVCEKYSGKFIVGMFGDTMQKIYMDGKEDLAKCIPDNWIKPVKIMNHRSAKRIVTLANSIRSTVDALYVSDNTRFATHQGVKGLEFPRVMVILDDAQAKGFLFSYEKLFGVKAQSDTDIKNERDGKDTGITRTARLFYVACTRAENSLAVVAYTENEELVKATALSNGWFLENEIYII